MVEHHNMLLDLSVLNRNINKYYDAVLEQFGIGSGRLWCFCILMSMRV